MSDFIDNCFIFTVRISVTSNRCMIHRNRLMSQEIEIVIVIVYINTSIYLSLFFPLRIVYKLHFFVFFFSLLLLVVCLYSVRIRFILIVGLFQSNCSNIRLPELCHQTTKNKSHPAKMRSVNNRQIFIHSDQSKYN